MLIHAHTLILVYSFTHLNNCIEEQNKIEEFRLTLQCCSDISLFKINLAELLQHFCLCTIRLLCN